MTSKKPFVLGYLLIVAACLFCLIGFGTGYWYVSTSPDNLFGSIGLWQACFNGYEHTSDLIGKAYYGCWWLFYKEYYYIRDWLLPPWFIWVQTLMTFAALFHMILIVCAPFTLLFLDRTLFLRIACFLDFLIASCVTISVTIFGVMIGLDRTWMPGWESNVLGWSYGLVVFSGFLSWFSLICMAVFTCMREYDLEKNPPKVKTTQYRKIFSKRPKV